MASTRAAPAPPGRRDPAAFRGTGGVTRPARSCSRSRQGLRRRVASEKGAPCSRVLGVTRATGELNALRDSI